MECVKKNDDFASNNNYENSFPRTKFLLSVGYLMVQVVVPSMLVFLLTGTDFSFTFKLPLSLMIVITLGLIVVVFLLTLLTYKLKLHEIDQFTYTIPFAFVLGMIYITGYFLSPQQILIRFIIAIAGSIFGILLTSIILLLVIRKKQLKSYVKI